MTIQNRSGLRAVSAAVALITVVSSHVAAQGPRPIGDAPFDSAYFAWEAGNYPQALAQLQRLLSGPQSARYRMPAALLTGEFYTTSELTRDGRNPRWSMDGSLATYETGPTTSPVTHLVQVANGTVREMGSIKGSGAALGSNGALAYIDAGDGVSAATRAIVVRDASGAERRVAGLQPTALMYARDGALHYTSGTGTSTKLFRLDGTSGVPVTTGGGTTASPTWLEDGTLVHGFDAQSFVTVSPQGVTTPFTGTGLSVAANGSSFAYISREGTLYKLTVARPDGAPLFTLTSPFPLAAPRLSPSGDRVVYQMMPREDWDLYVANTRGQGGIATGTRITHDIMHDIMPQFVADGRILSPGGEGRHRRSFLYDPATGDRTRLFHNNTVRTVAPEYEWVVSPDGTRVLIVSERDGDTVSPERGVYMVDVRREVSVADVLARVNAMRVAENDLRTRGRAAFAPLAARVAAVTSEISKDRIYAYASDLFAFDSKYITQPGNAKAIEYLAAKLRSWGYDPEIQYFETTPRGTTTAVRTANVVARLPGTMDQDATYVVSSHFDSVLAGAGADDDTSGTTALLEAARVLAKRPQPRTIEFAFFTGEEAGLLGSREYVRRAVADKKKIIGALNNDMVGFANDQRLDNTIRYSNPGIRDIQHAAAIQFTDLITYDAKYYKNTDANAYYDAYGDIVGGIGSYPILSNPHYHQSHDVLETINQQLVAEVSKTTVATLMMLATSPSRPSGVVATREGAVTRVTWNAAPESDVRIYQVEWGAPGAAARGRATLAGRNTTSYASAAIQPGDEIRVRSVNAAAMNAWDWARTTIKP